MSDPLLALEFVAAAAVSVATSWLLVSRLERVGARLGLTEGLLGVLAALAGDAPEITAAVTALAGHHTQIGAGVVIGSNVFNLAALLGLASILAGEIRLHRRVIVLEGAVAILIAVMCLAVVAGGPGPAIGLSAVLAVLIPYLIALGVSRERRDRLGLPRSWALWLDEAIVEEEQELKPAIHPQPARIADELVALTAALVVIGASVLMEHSASDLGTRHEVPGIVIGGIVLAAVTSLPNAVAGVYLALRGRGTATLSTAMNSNALNVAAGLFVPGVIVGLGAPSGQGVLVASWYLGLTALAVAFAYRARGLRRRDGVVIVVAYLAFVVVLVATA